MYDLLHDFVVRPEPFSRYTAKALWTRPHLAQQMLRFHLNQETELASRRIDVIDRTVAYLEERLGLASANLCDLGCGPGLYAQRFATRGAQVMGIDFSANSLAFAAKEAERLGQSITYRRADYLEEALPGGFDLVTLIYCDLCALSPRQRRRLLGRMRDMLNPGGRIAVDVAALPLLAEKQEVTLMEERLMDGFWSPGDYVGVQRTFLYAEEQLALDRYLIVEPDENWQIFNWLQHFTPSRLQSELAAAGFVVEEMLGSLSGEALTPESPMIGAIARKAS